ncbi:DUF91 domain-containing protein [Halobacteriales archaeon QS_1_68_20]|nr:MAG: DUF91 domain-containing protein [Halobacteriales archaeon QS_1_68_20]
MPDEPIRVLAGDCTVTYTDGDGRREERGHVATVVKPDNTVFVHDADGYQPVEWLTRADAVSCSRAEPETVLAQDGDRHLRVTVHAAHGFERFPASPAGAPVGPCPDCDGTLVRADGAIACLDCESRYGLPADAAVREESCDCGLPLVAVERGDAFEVCVDRTCEPLDEAVKARFDREWNCPECGGDLRILRRTGLIAGCADYPDCTASFAVPRGVADGTCDCGLPAFQVDDGRRCLDPTCGEAS